MVKMLIVNEDGRTLEIVSPYYSQGARVNHAVYRADREEFGKIEIFENGRLVATR